MPDRVLRYRSSCLSDGRTAGAGHDAVAIAVGIVNYNTREHLRACLASVVREAPIHVVVVDNASSDGSTEMVRAEYPGTTLCRNERNSGYGAAANQAIAVAAAEYVLLLNSDARLTPGALLSLQEYLDRHPRAAVVGPRLIHPDGTLQPSAYPFPTPLQRFLEESSLWRLVGYIPRLGEAYERTWSHARCRIVPWILGAAMAIRRTAFEAVGGFDESYFLYFEEVDLSYRLRQAGWETHFAPVATVVHVGGASTRRYQEATRRMFTSAAYFYTRHYSLGRRRQLRLVVAGVMLGRLVRDAGRLRRMRDPSDRDQLARDVAMWRVILGDARSGWV